MNPASANNLMLKYYGLNNLTGKYLALSEILRLRGWAGTPCAAIAPVSPAGGKVRGEL